MRTLLQSIIDSIFHSIAADRAALLLRPPEGEGPDSLRIVAARIWGDSNLWYLLAEENGVTSPDVQLEAGMALRVPNEVVSMRNDAGSFKPFDVREVIGDTTPTQPAPPAPKPKKKGCGVLGQILVIVMAFMMLFAILIPAILGLASTNLKATTKIHDQRDAAWAVDGAMDGAIQYVRGDVDFLEFPDRLGREVC